jgi:hypothetical protein
VAATRTPLTARQRTGIVRDVLLSGNDCPWPAQADAAAGRVRLSGVGPNGERVTGYE